MALQVVGSGRDAALPRAVPLVVPLPAFVALSCWLSASWEDSVPGRLLSFQPDRKSQVSLRAALGSMTSVVPSMSQKRWPV